MKLSIKNGVITGFKDEVEIKGLEYEEIISKRVSNIYPINPFLKLLFKIIRNYVNNESKIANWTRNWNVLWTVHYKNKDYGNFINRKEAIKYEKKIVWEDIKSQKQ